MEKLLPKFSFSENNKLYILLIGISISAIAITLSTGPLITLFIISAIILMIIAVNIFRYNSDYIVCILAGISPVILRITSNNLLWLFAIIFVYYIFMKSMVFDNYIKLPPTPINVFLGIFFLLAVISDIYNLNRFNFLANIRIAIFCLTIFAYYSWQINKPIKYIYIIMFIPSVYMCIGIVYVLVNNLSIGGFLSLLLSRHTYMHGPNTLGAYLCVVIPILFSFILYKTAKYKQIFAWVMFVLLVVVMILTNSRATYLGVGISLFVMSLSKKNIRIPVIITLISIIIIYFNVPLFQNISDSILRFSNDIDSLSSGRTIIWEASLRAIKETALFGSGLGNASTDIYSNFNLIFEKYINGPRIYGHNLYLHKAVEIGIFAIPLFLYWFCLFFYKTLKRYFNASSDDAKAVYFGIFGMLIALFIRSFFEHSEILFDGRIFPDIYPWLLLPIIFNKYNGFDCAIKED